MNYLKKPIETQRGMIPIVSSFIRILSSFPLPPLTLSLSSCTAVKIHFCPSHGSSVAASRKLNVCLKDARVMLCVRSVKRNTQTRFLFLILKQMVCILYM